MTKKQKWLKNTGIKNGDRVICLDNEARRQYRRLHQMSAFLDCFQGVVDATEWRDEARGEEEAMEATCLLIHWGEMDTEYWGERITPFWVLAKYNADEANG